MAVRPVNVPVAQAGGGAAGTDSKGTFSVAVLVHPTNWAVVRLVGQTTGSALWVAASDAPSGPPLEFARGGLAATGLMLLAGGQRVNVQITGAQASVSVNAQLVGVMAPSLEEVLPFYSPAPNSIGQDAFNTSQLIGTITNAGSGDIQTQTIQLPGGAQGIGFAVSGVAPNQVPGAISITGGQTNLPYISMNSSTVVPAWATELFPEDTSVVCQVTGNAGAVPSITFIHSYTYNPRTRIQGSNSFLPIFVQNGSTPALWQAARSSPVPFFQLNLAGGATANLVPAVAGQTVYLHDYDYAFDTSTATNWQLEDTAGTILSYDAGTLVANKPYRFSGAPVAAGRGVQLHNAGAAAQSIRGHLTNSQG